MIGAFRDSARDFLHAEAPLARLRSLRESVPGFERSKWQVMAKSGWTGVLLPEAAGGLDLGLAAACAIAEEIGRNPLSEPFIAGALLPASVLRDLPDSTLRDDLIRRHVSGDLIAGLAWQEQLGQIDCLPITVQAIIAGDKLRIQGKKRWVVPGGGADGWLVSAMQSEEPVLCWLEAGTPGLKVIDQARIDGTYMADLEIEVEIPIANCLARGDSVTKAIDTAMDRARFAQAAELLGIARQSFEITLAYLNVRIQFGRPIGTNQALQHRMVDAYIQQELAAACLEEALDTCERAPDRLRALASRAKARCAHAATHITRLAVQFHGAIGVTDECDISLYVKRATNLCSWLGGAALHRRRYFDNTQRARAVETNDAQATSFPREADWASMSETDFRAMVRAFLRRHCPENIRFPSKRLHWHEARDWYMTLSRQGWLTPAWPKAHGGMELPPDKLLAFSEEFEQFGAPRLPDQGLLMIGPILIRYGSDDQKARYLPKILSGENIWCQGYSEPNAGSDLASLRTAAVLEGEHFVVTGQKTWTTLAQDATHIYLLVRTDPAAKKQAGISLLLVDLSTPGIAVRPIRTMSGSQEFCEVFFDAVKVPRTNLVGELNGGWTIAKSLLGFERIFVGSPKQCQYALAQLELLATSRQLFEDAGFAARYAELHLDVADLSAAYTHFADIVKRGEQLPQSVSMLKIWATETYTRVCALLSEAADEHGGDSAETQAGNAICNAVAPMLYAMVTTIYGGSNEIQRNILAGQVLRLPTIK